MPEIDLLARFIIFLEIAWILLVVVIWRKQGVFSPILLISISVFMHFPGHGIMDLTVGSHILEHQALSSKFGEFFILSHLYGLVGYLCIVLGYMMVSEKSNPLYIIVPKFVYPFKRKRVFLVSALLILLSMISFYFLTIRFGGLIPYLTEKYLTRTAEGVGYLNLVLGFSVSAFLMLTAYSYVTRQQRLMLSRWRRLFQKLYWGFAGGVALFAMVTTGSRGAVVFLLAQYLFIRHYLHKPLNYRWAVSAGIMILTLISLLQLYRNEGGEHITERALASTLSPTNILKEPFQRAYVSDSFTVLLHDFSDKQALLGDTILPIVYAWIPRDLWPDKPITSTGKLMAETHFAGLYKEGTAIAIGMFSDSYINFDLLGVIIVALIVGMLLRVFFAKCVLKSMTLPIEVRAPRIYFYSSISYIPLMMLENSIYGAIASYLPIVVFSYLFTSLSTGKLTTKVFRRGKLEAALVE